MFHQRPDQNFPNDYRPDWNLRPPQKPEPGRIWLRVILVLVLLGAAVLLYYRG